MTKIKPSHLEILRILANSPDDFVIPTYISVGGLKGTKLRDMIALRLVEYGKKESNNLYGYRITPAGLNAIKES